MDKLIKQYILGGGSRHLKLDIVLAIPPSNDWKIDINK